MREEERSGINCAEESYGVGDWSLRTASGADMSAQPASEGITVRRCSQASQVGAERRR